MIALGPVGASLGGVALFAGSGLGLAELSPALRRIPLARRLGYSYLLGLVAVAGALYALSHFAAVPLRAPAVWTIAAALAGAGLGARMVRVVRVVRVGRAGRSPSIQDDVTPRRSLVSRLGGAVPLACFGVMAIVCCGLLAEAATNPEMDWDGRMTWSTQARYIRAAGTVDAEVLRNRRWSVTHPQYPLLLPVAQVAVLEAFAQGEDSHAYRALYVGCFVAWLLVLYDGARRLAGRIPAALAVLFAALVPFFAHGEGGAFSAYSDLPLAGFYGAALALLLLGPRRLASGWAAGLFLAGAVLAKNEGLLLAGVVLALAAGRALAALRAAGREHGPGPAARRLVRRRLLGAAIAGALAIAALALLVSWRAGVPNREDEAYLSRFGLADLWPGLVSHFYVLARACVGRMITYMDWTTFWWMIPAVLAAGRRRLPLVLLAAAAAPPAIGWLAYAVNPQPAFVASVTWDRFLLQASVPLMLLVAGALADILQRRRRARTPPRELAPTAR